MRELIRLANSARAAKVQAALQAHGIEAEVITELANAYTGFAESVVWVDEAVDKQVAREICEECLQAMGFGTNDRVSRIEDEPDETSKCVQCGYSLRGQVADGKCPECGHPYQIVGTRKCQSCNESVPSDFDICWNCGSEMPAA
jgi:rubrerythrin